MNEICLVCHSEKISFDAFKNDNFNETALDTVLEMKVVRKAMYNYLKNKLFIYNRTPTGPYFSTEWNHASDILIHKAVKDMLLATAWRYHSSGFNLNEANDLFFHEGSTLN